VISDSLSGGCRSGFLYHGYWGNCSRSSWSVSVWSTVEIIPTNSNIDTVITLIVPYIMYVGAEHFHFSGVLAVVAGGLLMSYNSHCYLSHLKNSVRKCMECVDLPDEHHHLYPDWSGTSIVVEGMKEYTISDGIFYSVVIGGAIIGTRILYSYALMYFPRLCSKELRLKV
jgi:CPA1 family monovalent cation:H+ antiporter